MLIRLLDNLYIGNSEAEATLEQGTITATLNVANDLISNKCFYHGFETMHVGLIDGPGNDLNAYKAAVCALSALLQKHTVLVFCHSGSRALAVSMLYLTSVSGQKWEDILNMFVERSEESLPEIHPAHMKVSIK